MAIVVAHVNRYRDKKMKPHIKRDRWSPDGWICRSVELISERNWLGGRRKVAHVGTGATPAAAYLDWYFRYHFKRGYAIAGCIFPW